MAEILIDATLPAVEPAIVPVENDGEAALRRAEALRRQQIEKAAYYAGREAAKNWSYLGGNNPNADGYYDF